MVLARISAITLAACPLVLASSVGLASDYDIFGTSAGPVIYQDADDRFTFSTGIGLLALEAREWVFTGAGSTDNLSLLIWQSLAPTFTADFQARPGGGWTFDLDTQIAGFGDSYMEDYDWIAPFNTGYGPDDWSHRSQHPDTALEWFFNSSFAVGKNVIETDNAALNLRAGFELTSTSWSAYGGSGLYSVGGFRDTAFTIPAGVQGITYSQMLPEVFVGVDGSVEHGPWKLSGGAKAGLTVLGRATDIHWLRDLRFEENVDPAPVLGANVEVAYQVADGMRVFVGGQVNNVFLGRSDTIIYDNTTGAELGQFPDASGAELFSATLTAGLSGEF